MTVIVINIKEERIDSEDQPPSDVLESLLIPTKSPDDDTVDPKYVQKFIRRFPSDALEIRQSTHEPDWEFGKPCPVCGNETLSAMTVSEDIYNSRDGDSSTSRAAMRSDPFSQSSAPSAGRTSRTSPTRI